MRWMTLLLAMFITPAYADYVLFEADPVRPLALSSDGQHLFALNTPDDRLEIFRVSHDGLVHLHSVPVGMRPVAIALRSDSEAWVVNHLSDSVSIVALGDHPRVVRTLLVGDEPRDIVFAADDRAFIATAHRGQASPAPAGDYDIPGIGRADVWVFDADDTGLALGGAPLTIVNLFGDKPRPLAVSPDGNTVYAGIFRSGNRTTAVNEGLVCNGGATAAPCPIQGGTAPGGMPPPNSNHEGLAAPETGLIVQYDPAHGQWRDELQRDWNDAIRFDLPDLDVFSIDASADTPISTGSVSGVGTVLFNIAVNPASGKLYVSNTDANNRVRFEGPGVLAATVKPSAEPATVRGELHATRITVIDGPTVTPRHLNKHIDYAAVPVPAAVKERSLAIPTSMVVSSDGQLLYLAAFGSSAVAILSTSALEDDSFVPASADQIPLSGGGPAGLALDEARNRLYVLTRFDNSVTGIDLGTRSELFRRTLHNPEPTVVVNGRPFLYDARLTSSNGEASCASCHLFGDMDDLAWDLGDPDGDVEDNPNPFAIVTPGNPAFHPMKGPMTTQSLRGLANHGPMHWRGDRTGGNASPPVSPLDESAAFNAFNVAFGGLLGRDEGELDAVDMQAFTDFALRLSYPPNPIRRLDNALRPHEMRGRDAYFQSPGPDLIASCNGCHTLDTGSGFFGGDGNSSTEGETQEFKIAHLRNLYQKVGMFGMPDVPFLVPGDSSHRGDQVRGFGYLHDGSIDTVASFFRAVVFAVGFDAFFPDAQQTRDDLEAFMMVFDTGLAPVVGQQVTLTGTNAAVAGPRIDLLLSRADAGEADLTVSAVIGGQRRSAVYDGGVFVTDLAAEPPLTDAAVRALAVTAGQELTYLAVPPGSGWRVAVDRDRDGVLNGDDNCIAVANADQTDTDLDNVGQSCDNCPLAANFDQRDSNGDGFGNRCDADLDNDGVVNFSDLALMREVFFAVGDLDADLDGDGAVNFADLLIMKESFFGAPGR